MADEPKYSVTEDLGDGVEIRRYAKQVWALTSSSSGDGAFMTLLSYISGKNTEGREIPMTAPVISWTSGEGVSMAFIMPEGIDQKDAPAPLSEEIAIKEVNERLLAVVSFSGYTSPEDYDRNLAILANKLKKRDIKPTKGPFLFRYNDPWTQPLERRNEIAYDVE